MLVQSTASFNKDIAGVRDKKVALRIQKCINMMQSANNVSEISSVKKLSGSANAYRVRIADDRLGFILIDQTI